MKQQALILIKPDGMQKGIAPEVLKCFLDGDLKLIGLKVVQVSTKLAEAHYGHLKGKFFFEQIVDYLTGKLHGGQPVIAFVLSGQEAIKKCRDIAGATSPEDASPLSVRGKFGRITTKGVYENLVHVSSDIKEAKREIALWFKTSELLKD